MSALSETELLLSIMVTEQGGLATQTHTVSDDPEFAAGFIMQLQDDERPMNWAA